MRQLRQIYQQRRTPHDDVAHEVAITGTSLDYSTMGIHWKNGFFLTILHILTKYLLIVEKVMAVISSSCSSHTLAHESR
jgi:hypothetical protein